MKELLHRPETAAIVGSLRSIGYSFNTALADIIDNSISAYADHIYLRLEGVGDEPILTFLDDGQGMDRDDLIEAMRHGGKGVATKRSASDLGRYGLGLKTASLSQCRRLTVASIGENGSLSVARWDLDKIEKRNDWILTLPTRQSIAKLKSAQDFFKTGRGTLVIWEEFDLAIGGAGNKLQAIETLLDDARTHLSTVFQRFLENGDSTHLVSIYINGLELRGIDPFLSSNPKTQQLPTEDVKIGNARARITAFILPQLKNVSPAELATLGGASGIRQGQGFYVYRNKRLIIAATWFRMLRFDELTKLARVRIDIPNTMDHLWNLDVKKSVATPPEAVKRALRRIIERIAARSLDVFKNPRQRGKNGTFIPVWLRQAHGTFASYAVNREHPLINELLEDESKPKSRAIDRLLRLVEVSVPYSSIYADLNGHTVLEPASLEVEKALRELLAEWIARCGNDAEMKRAVINALPSLDPFSAHPELTRALVEAYTHGN